MGRQGHPVQNCMQEIAKNLPASLSSSSSSIQSILSAFVPCESIVHCISMQIVRIVADNRINANIIFNSIFDGFVFPIIRVFIDSSLPPIRSLTQGLFFSLSKSFFLLFGVAGLEQTFCFVPFNERVYVSAISHASFTVNALSWLDCTWCYWYFFFSTQTTILSITFQIWNTSIFAYPPLCMCARIYFSIFTHSFDLFDWMINTIGYDRF